MIKLLIGGSPCTNWSIAQTTAKRECEPKGIGWELFKNYVIAKDNFQPDYFLYENNMSADIKIKNRIEKELHQKLQPINSSLVSAQNRSRFYVHNIPNVEQPEDRGIILNDILEDGENLTCGEKAYCLTASYNGAVPYNTIERKQRSLVAVIVGYIGNEGQGNRVYSVDGKSVCLCGNSGGAGGKTGLYSVPITQHQNIGNLVTIDKSLPQLVDKYGYIPEAFNPYNSREINEKSPTLMTSGTATGIGGCVVFEKSEVPVYVVSNGIITINGKKYPSRLKDGYYIIRKLTVTEAKRLQTVPDDYKMPCSTSQNYKMLGNGWTVDVIAHILSHIPNIKSEEIVVLSMYDGMSCGHIALDKIGAKVVKYYATEIDKYCIETTQTNYPDTIQLGDATYVRSPFWWRQINY